MGYMPFWNACYKITRYAFSWESADHECKLEGANLASIHSNSENAGLTQLINSESGLDSVWIGLNDKEVGLLQNSRVLFTIYTVYSCT